MPLSFNSPKPPPVDGPWKTWAPSLVGIAGMVFVYVAQEHRGGSSKLTTQLQEQTVLITKLTAKVESLCDRLTEVEAIDIKQDSEINQLREAQARLFQRLGMNR